MVPEIIAERFVLGEDGSWCDLATGDAVLVDIRAMPDDWEERSERLAEELAAGSGYLIDFGRLGVSRWFEARRETRREATRADELSLADVADEVVAAASRSEAFGVRFVKPATVVSDAALAADRIARRLRPLGFVALRAGMTVPPDCYAELQHRHLAVLLFSQQERHEASEWVRRLAKISVRGHLLVDLSGGPARLTSSIARERRPAASTMERARASAERGRARNAEEWYRAAVESGRRHRNDLVQVEACRALVRLLLSRDAWTSAVCAAEGSLRSIRGATARADLSAVLAGLYLARGQVANAESLLAAAHADLRVAGAPPAESVQHGLAELRFWQGRFEEAGALLAGHLPSLDTHALHGLVCWATGNGDGLQQARSAVESMAAGEANGRFWSAVLRVLAWSSTVEAGELATSIAELERAAQRTRSPCLVRLARISTAETLLLVGRFEQAVAALGPKQDWRHAPVRDHLLRARIETSALGVRSARLALQIDRTGLFGIRRWGIGSHGMHLIHTIPAVLELVHDAEDELAALTTACKWTRRECGAEAVAFLAASDGRTVVSDGWSPEHNARIPPASSSALVIDDGRVFATAPVRYSGVQIGVVSARGPAERTKTLEEAVRVLSALCAPALKARLDVIAMARQGQALTPEILGRSPAIVALKETIGRAAATPFTVLIEGESGTGKELVARAVHRLSPRRDRRFAAFNCAAISDELVEAELFGHARGAFTGAVATRAGLFEDAHAGSLFLDEVSELSVRAQAKLLRVLQEREVRRVGENAARPIDVRVIAATNRPLAAAVRSGAFREDLLFRLAVVCIRLPPLRDRLEDLPVLAEDCWRSLTRQAGKRAVLGPDALAALCRHGWPGNVREFQNVMAALVVLAPTRGRIGTRHVRQVLGPREDDVDVVPLEHVRARSERHAVTGALARHGGRRAPAARDLGLTRQGLAKAMKRLGLARQIDTVGVA